MGKLVDLTAKPYYLSPEQIQWVEATIGGMTDEEKVGQLFTHLHDATMVKCYINACHSNMEIIKQVVDKIMGESEFKGKPNDLVWAGKLQAKL